MRYWLLQISLLSGMLLFVDRLPALGSMSSALLAAMLAMGTIWAACAVLDHLRGEILASEHVFETGSEL